MVTNDHHLKLKRVASFASFDAENPLADIVFSVAGFFTISEAITSEIHRYHWMNTRLLFTQDPRMRFLMQEILRTSQQRCRQGALGAEVVDISG